MRFSLVVCTLGRSNELVEFFESLVRQNRTDFEAIVVDQNTDDRLNEIVERFSERFPLKRLRMTGTGLSRARNLGISHATGELIGFPDDDCRYLDGYLDAVDNLFRRDSSLGALSGNPTADPAKTLDCDLEASSFELNSSTLLNRCQEFTVFVRRSSIQGVRYNECLGVGAKTLWGAEEGPDFLIRLLQSGTRLIYFPKLLVYHPDKIEVLTRATLDRAASYARGRGCLFRLHKFPVGTVLTSLFRPAIGCLVFLLRANPMRAAYYLSVVQGTLRGLRMSKAELNAVRKGVQTSLPLIDPIPLRSLPSEPLVSVLVANYNYARFLPAALNSLITQTYSRWHAIVCDDGSTDESVEVIREYAARDARIELLAKSNGGQNSTYNACYQKARGEIICFLDADDLFDARKIERVVESLRATPAAGICNHFSQVIDAQDRPQTITMHRSLDSGWLAKDAFTRGACVYIPTTSCMSIRRELADVLFPIPPHQDRDLDGYIGMAAQFLAPVCVIHEKLAKYRIHSSNMGGLTEPTPQRLRYELHLIELRTSTVKDFVRQRFGQELAGQIMPEDNPQYIQAALKLLAIEPENCRWKDRMGLIRRHPNAIWRAIWRAIFAAPGPLTRLAIPWLHRSHRIKSIAHRLMDRMKAVTA